MAKGCKNGCVIKFRSGNITPTPVFSDGECKNCWKKKAAIASRDKNKSIPKTPITINEYGKKIKLKIKCHSEKTRVRNFKYSKIRKAFMADHDLCEAKISEDCTHFSQETHHKQGRAGELLFDISKFLAVCHNCHVHITKHSAQAIELGLSLPRNT